MLDDPQYYLEIGVDKGYTFEAVRVPNRIAVDPRPQFDVTRMPDCASVHVTTSDGFFARTNADSRFDLFFIDGLHTYEQTYRDIMNCLKYSHPWSLILVDDVVPSDAVSAMRSIEQSQAEHARLHSRAVRWYGDVFRVMLILQDHHPDLYFRTIVGKSRSSNDQAIIWQRSSIPSVTPVSNDILVTYMNHTFEEVFQSGVPELFHPGSENEVMEDIRHSCSH
jgi:hypothetical protein